MRRVLRWIVPSLLVLVVSACATGKSVSKAEAAARAGDWDTAVAYYREALGRDPKRLDLRVSLQHALASASEIHLKRARDLEAQDQIAGAAAEYRLAADLNPVNAFAASKAMQLERGMREQAEANRPPSRIEQLQQQALQTSPVPRLDPRQHVFLSFPRASVGDILRQISTQFDINITYDSGVQAQLGNSYTVTFNDTPLEEAFTKVLSANTLTFKVTGPKEIFVYQDSATNRQKYEDQFFQLFYISNAEPGDIIAALTQIFTQGTSIRPILQPVKSANAIAVKATAPIMALIAQMISTMDKPKAEVLIDVEVLEVDRTRARQLGIDLSQYALGFTFSPEVAPPNTAGTPNAFPGQPPPFNLNTITHGVGTNDFYLNVPTAMIRLLESDQKTRLLAKPQLRGREGFPMTLNLGDQIPVIQTNLLSASAGGVPTIPQQQVQYRNIGVNLSVTPIVTFRDEILLNSLQIDKSGLGADINVGGTNYTTFVDRTATVNLQLRDGESSLLAGLIREEEKKTLTSLPGILHIPFFRHLFGSSGSTFEQSDIVMIVTPHILRSHELTVNDLKPILLGSAANYFAGGTVPTLLPPGGGAPATVPLTGPIPPGGGTQPPATGGAPPANPTGTATTTPPPASTTPPPATTGGSRAVGVVPVQPVDAAPTGGGQITVSTPGAELSMNGGPYPVPIQIANVAQVSTVVVTVTYNPAVLRATVVNQGTFMSQGNVTPTFAPKIDAAAGRVDIAISRPDQAGASATTAMLLAAIQFTPVAAGTSPITVSAVVNGVGGKPLTVQTSPATVVVK